VTAVLLTTVLLTMVLVQVTMLVAMCLASPSPLLPSILRVKSRIRFW
jgi:hypothetical protein